MFKLDLEAQEYLEKDNIFHEHGVKFVEPDDEEDDVIAEM